MRHRSPLFALLQTQCTLKFTDHPQPRAQDNQQTEHLAVLDALLEAGADPNVRLKTHLWFFEWENKFGHDITGATPFWRAAFAQDLDAMKALAAHGADPNIPTMWPEPGMRDTRQEDGRTGVLQDALYGWDDEADSNTLEVFISRLRRKLGRGHIVTLRGLGYRLAPSNEED